MALHLLSRNRTRPTAKSFKEAAGLATLLTVAMLAAGCGGEKPALAVNSSCEVFTDSLRDVRATTPAGDVRISKHFESGIEANCWSR